MRRPDVMISTAAGERLELFLVSGVATVLAIRAFLAATGFPQIGGGGLHIAHLLWGGLGMSLALILALSALGRRPFTAAALVGGIGFGFFIDEIGKFVTSDNDYFYRPAIALIYLAFIALAVLSRFVTRGAMAPGTALANAMDLISSARHDGIDSATRDRIDGLLELAPQEDPLVPALRSAADAIPIVDREASRLTRARDRAAGSYAAFAGTTMFRRLAIAYGIVYVGLNLPLLLLGVGGVEFDMIDVTTSGPYAWATAPAVLVGIALTGFGTYRLLRGRRASGFRWLRSATVFSMLVTQPIAFWNQEFEALPGFALLLLAYIAFGYAANREEEAALADAPAAGR